MFADLLIVSLSTVLASGRHDGCLHVVLCFTSSTRSPRRPEQQEGKGAVPLIRKDLAAASYGCPAGAERTHRDDTAKGEETFEKETVTTYV
jgi:hypothetical protein